MPNETTFQKIKTKASQPLVAVAIIALAVFGIWISVQGAKSIPSVNEYLSLNVWPRLNSALVSVTSLFIPAEKIEVSLDKTAAESSDPVTLTWTHTSKRGDGVYTFYYPCLNGLTLETSAAIKIECDKELDIKSEQTLRLVPILSSSTLDVPVHITYTKENGAKVAAFATLRVISKSQAAATPATPAQQTATPPLNQNPSVPTSSFTEFETVPGTTTQGATSQSTYTLTQAPSPLPVQGQPDLTVKVLAVGAIDTATNVFTAKEGVFGSERAAVKFEIINIGNKKVDGWTFNAVLPTFPSHIFHSDTQLPLAPGDKIEFTLGFDQIDTTSGTTSVITIYADPTNSINESNKDNNLAQAKLTIKK